METWINNDIYYTISTDGEIHRFYILAEDDTCNEIEVDICIIRGKGLDRQKALEKFKTLFVDMIDNKIDDKIDKHNKSILYPSTTETLNGN